MGKVGERGRAEKVVGISIKEFRNYNFNPPVIFKIFKLVPQKVSIIVF